MDGRPCVLACIFINLPGYSGERRREEDATHAWVLELYTKQLAAPMVGVL